MEMDIRCERGIVMVLRVPRDWDPRSVLKNYEFGRRRRAEEEKTIKFCAKNNPSEIFVVLLRIMESKERGNASESFSMTGCYSDKLYNLLR